MKSLRATLEEDLGLATGTLKPHKKFLGELFNDFANAQDNNEEEEAPSPESAKKKKKSDKSKQKKRKSGGSTDDDEPAPKSTKLALYFVKLSDDNHKPTIDFSNNCRTTSPVQ